MQASFLTVQGLFTTQPNATATIARSPTLPAPRTSSEYYFLPNLSGWGSEPVELDGGETHLELLDLVSERASSVVYSARVLPGPSHELNLLTEICVKIARPTRCRSLARDAWFYEQLDREEGISPLDQDSVPSAMLQNMRPWVETLETDIGDDGEGGMMAARNDLLTDERDPLWHFFDDPLDSNTYSPRKEWEFDEKNPTLATLLLEKLGRVYHGEDEEARCGEQHMRADVSDLLGDLSGVGVLHGDVRRFNVLSAAGDLVAKEECPRHGRVHGWRIIDFEYGREFVVDPAYAPKHDINLDRDAKRHRRQ